MPLLSFLVAGSGAGSLLVLLVTDGLVPVTTGLVSSGWFVSMSSVSVSGRSLASSRTSLSSLEFDVCWPISSVASESRTWFTVVSSFPTLASRVFTLASSALIPARSVCKASTFPFRISVSGLMGGEGSPNAWL